MRMARALLMLLVLVVASAVAGADQQAQPFAGEVCATVRHDCRPHCGSAELPELLGNVWHFEECRNLETKDVTQRMFHRHRNVCCWR